MPDPVALAFDTSAAHCAAALLSGDRVLGGMSEPMTKGQAERLMPILEEILAAAGVGWRDLAAIGVGTGPGSFTGTRVAVAAARGLALGLAIPAIGVGQAELTAADGGADADPAATATAIAGIALLRHKEPAARPAPVYARPADAAPARDRGPVILPG